MAKSLDDILASQDKAFAKIEKIKTVEDSVFALVSHQKDMLTDLQAQLDAAIAAGDMAKVQKVSDNMDTINAALDAQEAADAVVAGTPADPVPVDPNAPAAPVEGAVVDGKNPDGSTAEGFDDKGEKLPENPVIG